VSRERAKKNNILCIVDVNERKEREKSRRIRKAHNSALLDLPH
jgi:hypothetical protein